jgi:hypothetical protein
MEAALKSLWVVGRVAERRIPQSLERLVAKVEEAFPKFHNIFSIQMERKDRFGNDAYRKVNGWAHSDPEMWTLYRNGEELLYVVRPLGNLVAFAQAELLRYDPTLVTEQRYWSSRYDTNEAECRNTTFTR